MNEKRNYDNKQYQYAVKQAVLITAYWWTEHWVESNGVHLWLFLIIFLDNFVMHTQCWNWTHAACVSKMLNIHTERLCARLCVVHASSYQRLLFSLSFLGFSLGILCLCFSCFAAFSKRCKSFWAVAILSNERNETLFYTQECIHIFTWISFGKLLSIAIFFGSFTVKTPRAYWKCMFYFWVYHKIDSVH